MFELRTVIICYVDWLPRHSDRRAGITNATASEMVVQEIYAHLLVYFAIRSLIDKAAEKEEIDPDRVSFMASLRVVRR